MATSSIANLFSFFTPSKPPPLPPSPALRFFASPSSSTTRRGWVPLVISNEAQPLPYCSSDATSVVFPSLAYSNTMFFRSAYNVQVIVADNEPEEKLLGRFRREVFRAGVIQECKRRRFFENKQEEKKRKSREAARRNRRRRPQARTSLQDREETPKNKKEDEDKDNWALPEGNLPY